MKEDYKNIPSDELDPTFEEIAEVEGLTKGEINRDFEEAKEELGLKGDSVLLSSDPKENIDDGEITRENIKEMLKKQGVRIIKEKPEGK